MKLCVCVCVCERERERLYDCWAVSFQVLLSVCGREREREREREKVLYICLNDL